MSPTVFLNDFFLVSSRAIQGMKNSICDCVNLTQRDSFVFEFKDPLRVSTEDLCLLVRLQRFFGTTRLKFTPSRSNIIFPKFGVAYISSESY